jgi:hypothetical protein
MESCMWQIAAELYSQQNSGESDRPDKSAEFGFPRYNVCWEGRGRGGGAEVSHVIQQKLCVIQ